MNQSSLSPFRLSSAGGPFDDPAMLLELANRSSLLLFDCGSLGFLKTRALLRVEWLFLSHAHIDHLIGFDHLLRLRLFSELPLSIFGPPGTIDIISSRLQGYSWNLTSGSPFAIEVWELPERSSQGRLISQQFRCHTSFQPEKMATQESSASIVQLSPGLRLHWHFLCHGVPCLAFRLDFQAPPKFDQKASQELGLSPGPWIGKLIAGQEIEIEIDGQSRQNSRLIEHLLSPGQSYSLGYLTDTLLDPGLSDDLALFFDSVDILVSESAYLAQDLKLATQNLHMTTLQVGQLAQKTNATKLLVFHLSRRYHSQGAQNHLDELRSIFPATELLATAT